MGGEKVNLMVIMKKEGSVLGRQRSHSTWEIPGVSNYLAYYEARTPTRTPRHDTDTTTPLM
ncbi:hypothetical protein L195_g005321 [Trifolium pratense]|uniref:Uncharacterized protein n=1 Tax=Trifolium pratense TaxID=57577 RepID=A0A2K3P0H5_TRIPR|nr:hypothetical protein L195_g005321 [Trifolium pratense]